MYFIFKNKWFRINYDHFNTISVYQKYKKLKLQMNLGKVTEFKKKWTYGSK